MDSSIAIILMVVLAIITFALEWCLYRMNMEITPILKELGIIDKNPFFVLTLYAVSFWMLFLLILAIIWMG